MGFNFPNTPTIGDLYPTPALPGVPQYRWDGAVWTTTTYDPLTWVQRAGDTMTGALNVVTPPTQAAHAASKAYVDAYAAAAAPLDALSYSGMQINGSMEVSQERGSTATGANSTYICDGWKMFFSGTMVVSAATLSATYFSGLPYLIYLGVTTAQASLGANDYTLIGQYIEGWRIARLGWGTAKARPITIGFWTGHNRTGVYGGVVRNSASNRTYAFNYTHNVSNVDQYNIITIPGDTTGTWATDNTIGINLVFAVGTGTAFIAPSANTWLAGGYQSAPGQINGIASTADQFRISGVVVLPGIYAPTAAQSPLIMRPYDQELVTCQRYYHKRNIDMIGAGQTGWAAGNWLMNPVRMRSTPTYAFSGGSSTQANPINMSNQQPEGVLVFFTIITGGNGSWNNVTQTADARL